MTFHLGLPLPPLQCTGRCCGFTLGVLLEGGSSGYTYHPGAPHSQGLFKSSGPLRWGSPYNSPKRDRQEDMGRKREMETDEDRQMERNRKAEVKAVIERDGQS